MENSPRYQRASIHSTNDLIAVADGSGSHFFTPGAMAFFSSRVLDGVTAIDGATTTEGARFLFVTSERHGHQPRHYAVRMMTLESKRDNRPAVDVMVVGDYHHTATQARTALRAHAKGLAA